MGKFNGLLQAEFISSRNWRVLARLSFNSYRLTPGEIAVLRNVGVAITASGTVTVPVGFETDLGSVPRLLWGVVAPQDIARPAVVHDYIYRCIKQYKFNTQKEHMRVTASAKAIADAIFKSALTVCSPTIPMWKQRVVFWFAAIFGWVCLRARDYQLHQIGK
jgi:hypothetical protein